MRRAATSGERRRREAITDRRPGARPQAVTMEDSESESSADNEPGEESNDELDAPVSDEEEEEVVPPPVVKAKRPVIKRKTKA